MRALHFVAAALLTVTVATPTAHSSESTSTTELSTALSQVSDWSASQLANEVIAVSAQASTIASMMPAAKDGYGGLLLFGSTGLMSTKTLLGYLQKNSTNGMLVMTDEEGGGVERLTNLVPSFPWPQRMGATMTPAQIQAVGQKTGTALENLGINTDLAPVLDLDARPVLPSATNPDGLRSFGGSASLVSSDGISFMEGLQAAGVLSVVKHFPGLGYSSGNTDFGPAHTLPLATLQKGGLLPFQAAIASGVGAVMMSNASVPGLTSLPASISPAAISYLRNTMGFQGLVVTDSLGAGAISALHISVPQAAVEALGAGADLVLYGTPHSVAQSLGVAAQISSAIVKAVASGTLPLSTLQSAAAQVLAARQSLVSL